MHPVSLSRGLKFISQSQRGVQKHSLQTSEIAEKMWICRAESMTYHRPKYSFRQKPAVEILENLLPLFIVKLQCKTLGVVVMKELLVVVAERSVISTELVVVYAESSVAVSSESELFSTESVGIAEESSVAVGILVG